MKIEAGHNNYMNSDKIVAIMRADSAPNRRLMRFAKQQGNSIDLTFGKTTNSIIITDSFQIVLSNLKPQEVQF